MTHPTLKAMVEAAKKATPGEWYEGPWWVYVPKADGIPARAFRNVLSGVPEAQANCAFVVAAQPANILALAEYVRGLEEKAAALLEEVTYLSGKYPLEPSLSGLEVAASDLRVALGGKP